MANTKASVVSTSAVDDDAPSSVAATGRGVDASNLGRPRVLEDDKSDDGLKTNDPERNESEDERQLVNGAVVIRDGNPNNGFITLSNGLQFG